ncbi:MULTISPECIES: hypothetical protein [unclassified Paenibacillus]|nr:MULTISPECIES: hypothetical protein [unclassified Paenibacillus]
MTTVEMERGTVRRTKNAVYMNNHQVHQFWWLFNHWIIDDN